MTFTAMLVGRLQAGAREVERIEAMHEWGVKVHMVVERDGVRIKVRRDGMGCGRLVTWMELTDAWSPDILVQSIRMAMGVLL